MKIAIPLGLGVFLIWYIYQSFTPTQIAETKKYFADANYGFVLLSVFLSVLSHFSRAYRWSFMLEAIGYKTKIANNFMAVSVAYLMNIFIPKSGEVSRAVILDKYENVPFQKGFGTIISERIVDLLFLLFFTALAFIIKFEILYDYIFEAIPASILYVLAAGILLIIISVPIYIRFSKSNINKRLKDFIIGLKEGVFSILKMKKKVLLFSIRFLFGAYIYYRFTLQCTLYQKHLTFR